MFNFICKPEVEDKNYTKFVKNIMKTQQDLENLKISEIEKFKLKILCLGELDGYRIERINCLEKQILKNNKTYYLCLLVVFICGCFILCLPDSWLTNIFRFEDITKIY